MNKFRMAKAGINVNEAIERLGGDQTAYEALLAGYLDSKYADELLENISKGDSKSAFEAAHALKGIAGNLSLSKVYESVVPIVEKLRMGDLSVDMYLPAFTEANDRVILAIKDMTCNQ